MTPESIFDMMLQGPVICITCSEDGAKIAAGDRNGRLTLADRGGNLNWEKEVEEAQNFWKFDFDAHESLTNNKSRIIVVNNVEKK